MKCSNCGAEFEGRFCPKCGTAAAVPTAPPADSTQQTPPAQKQPKGVLGKGRLYSIWKWGMGICSLGAVLTFFQYGYIWQGIIFLLFGIAEIVTLYMPLRGKTSIVVDICLIAVLFIPAGSLDKNEAYIDQVREARPLDTVSYETAFDGMFESGKWSCDRKAETVEYKGKYKYDGYGSGIEEARIVFSIDAEDGTCQVSQVYVDGEMLDEDPAYGVCYAAFVAEDGDKNRSLKDLAHIAGVWGAENYDYPDINFKDAFDAFFVSGDWGFDGKDTVVFSGEFDDGDASYDITIEFKEENEGFSYVGITVNGDAFGSYGASEAVDEIFASYDGGAAA